MANNIIPVIERSGGRVLVGAKVKSVMVQKNIAIGVELTDGTKIQAKHVISDAGF